MISMSEVFDPPAPLQTAVLFLVFNRPDTTKQVFRAIRRAKPPRLYVAADGPRASLVGEAERTEQVRKISTAVDWPCEVKTLFRSENLGCKYAVSSAISWFFQNEAQGIILEDDCLPSQSFFWYCEELLIKYKEDNSVYSISGDSRGSEHIHLKGDYTFCKYPLIWGWASWRRVWQHYDVEILDWPQRRDILLKKISQSYDTTRFWTVIFSKMYKRKINTWDYQFVYLHLINNASCIVPGKNLISNIGFGPDATHTFIVDLNSNRALHELILPLNHCVTKNSNKLVDSYFESNIFIQKNIAYRFFQKILGLLR